MDNYYFLRSYKFSNNKLSNIDKGEQVVKVKKLLSEVVKKDSTFDLELLINEIENLKEDEVSDLTIMLNKSGKLEIEKVKELRVQFIKEQIKKASDSYNSATGRTFSSLVLKYAQDLLKLIDIVENENIPIQFYFSNFKEDKMSEEILIGSQFFTLENSNGEVIFKTEMPSHLPSPIMILFVSLYSYIIKEIN